MCCIVCLRAVESGGKVEVRCVAASGEFPPEFSISVTASAGEAPCDSTSTIQSIIQAECCKSGTGFIYGKAKPNAAKCFIGAPSSPCEGLSALNKFTEKHISPITFPLLLPGSKSCDDGHPVGSITVQCASNDKGSRVTLGPLNRIVLGDSDPVFYLGCNLADKKSDCSAPAFGAPSTTCSASSPSASCGGRLPALGLEPQVFELGCPCQKVF